MLHIEPNCRMAVLKQNHYEFDNFNVIDTIIMGIKGYMKFDEKDLIYSKTDFTEADGTGW